jgi:tartrate dehydrogenase/decarboxylase/D-malate dehydrogenase
MFEPIHGSAPDIAGKGLANPVGMIWAVVFLLEHLGLEEMSNRLFASMAAAIRSGRVTPDIGGSCTTSEAVQAICNGLG